MLFKKSPLTSTRLTQRKRRIFIFKIVSVFVVVGIVIGGLVWFTRLPRFEITSTSVKGNIRIASADIQTIVDRHLAGSYLFLFPRKNTFMYPQEALVKDILTTYPTIESVKTTTESNVLTFIVAERKPSFVWCKGDPEHRDPNGCYFMDSTGYIFSEAPHFSGPVYFTHYGLLTTDNPIGQNFLPAQEFKNLNIFSAELERRGIKVTSCVSKDDGVRQLYLARGGRIVFKNSQNIPTLLSSFDLIHQQTTLFKAGATSTLDYLDLRFGNKVYYKF